MKNKHKVKDMANEQPHHRYKKPKILIFGDSHTRYFGITRNLNDKNPEFRDLEIKITEVTGGSAVGLGRKESSLKTLDTLFRVLNTFEPDYICFAFGQVDIEAGIYYRRIIKQQTFNLKEHIESVCSIYLKSISAIIEHKNISNKRVCIKGVNISSLTENKNDAVDYTMKYIAKDIEDIELLSFYRSNLYSVFPDIMERFQIHHYFNETLKSKSDGVFSYFDINDHLSDIENPAYCKPMFISSELDHHIVDSLYSREIHIRELLKALNDN